MTSNPASVGPAPDMEDGDWIMAAVRAGAGPFREALAPHPDREAEPTSTGPQLCNVCNGFVPTWGVKVCQCEYHAPAGTHPAEPTGGVVERVAKAINDRAGFTEYGPVIPEGLLIPIAEAAVAALGNWRRDGSASPAEAGSDGQAAKVLGSTGRPR